MITENYKQVIFIGNDDDLKSISITPEFFHEIDKKNNHIHVVIMFNAYLGISMIECGYLINNEFLEPIENENK